MEISEKVKKEAQRIFNYDKGAWVKWRHSAWGLNLPATAKVITDFIRNMSGCCQACIKLDGCMFLDTKLPEHYETKSTTREGRESGLLHKNCHCELEDIPPLIAGVTAISYGNITKFTEYTLSDKYNEINGKKNLFVIWGYGIMDSEWLMQEFISQAQEKYANGDYLLGKLNEHGQRLNIMITLPRRDMKGNVTFKSAWMIEPDGKIRLITPYAG